MGQPYIGEIRMFGGNFNPNGWQLCQGQTLPISENDALFTLIGTTYGGDGQSTFNLPNLSSRVPIHMGQGSGLTNRVIGEMAGVESVTLTTQQIPNHTHPLIASKDLGSARNPGNAIMSRAPADAYASEVTPDVMSAQTVQPQGGSQPHENMQPYLAINYIISLFGIFPQQT